MATVKLKIAELRKAKGISQQELADVLGISFQSVSKWETGVSMPDIGLLPDIAEFFQVTVDQLLGLKPLKDNEYIPRNTDDHSSYNGSEQNLYKNRKYFWNDDYLKYLITYVWKINKPVDLIEFRCCDGYFAKQLLDNLPDRSSYTGVDNEYFTDIAKLRFSNSLKDRNFITSDLYSFQSNKKYDIAVIQVGLRHMNKPFDILKKMVSIVKKGGLIICIDVNREIEKDGLYIDDIDYSYLCNTFDFNKIWMEELRNEGRDYAIGFRIPFYMEQLGLYDIDVRMNDKVLYVNPKTDNYDEILQDFIDIHGLDKDFSISNCEDKIEFFMSRGIDRGSAESYVKMQSTIAEYFLRNNCEKSFLKVQGLVITYGRK